MADRKKRPARRITRRWASVRRWCAARSRDVRIALDARLRPWSPAVEVDVKGKRGRRLRRAAARVARSHLRALGVTPPMHLLVVVQRTVALEGKPLAALLQVFEGGRGPTRHVLFLAASAGDRKVPDDEVLATLRQQLQRIVAAELGAPANTTTEPPRDRTERGGFPPPSEPPETTPLDELASSPAAFGGLNGQRLGAPDRLGVER